MRSLSWGRRAAGALSIISLISIAGHGAAAAVAQTPQPLVAEAPIGGDNEARGYAFLSTTIHGKAVSLRIDLENTSALQLSTAGLSQVGLDLGNADQLDSLTLGRFVERKIPLTLDPDPNWPESAPAG